MNTISFQIPKKISAQIRTISPKELVAILYYLEWRDTSRFELRLNEKWKETIEKIIKDIAKEMLLSTYTGISSQQISINNQTRNHPELSFPRIVRQEIIREIKEVLLNKNWPTSAWI